MTLLEELLGALDQIQWFLGIGSMTSKVYWGSSLAMNSALFPGVVRTWKKKKVNFCPGCVFLSQWINFWRMFHPTCKKKLSLADFEVLELILGNTHMKVKLWCPVSNFRATKQLSLFKMQSATKNKKTQRPAFHENIKLSIWQKLTWKSGRFPTWSKWRQCHSLHRTYESTSWSSTKAPQSPADDLEHTSFMWKENTGGKNGPKESQGFFWVYFSLGHQPSWHGTFWKGFSLNHHHHHHHHLGVIIITDHVTVHPLFIWSLCKQPSKTPWVHPTPHEVRAISLEISQAGNEPTENWVAHHIVVGLSFELQLGGVSSSASSFGSGHIGFLWKTLTVSIGLRGSQETCESLWYQQFSFHFPHQKSTFQRNKCQMPRCFFLGDD